MEQQTYEVEMGVPIPERKPGPGKQKSVKRKAMESLPIGGLVRFPYSAHSQQAALKMAYQCGIKVTTRTIDGKLCIWRVA